MLLCIMLGYECEIFRVKTCTILYNILWFKTYLYSIRYECKYIHIHNNVYECVYIMYILIYLKKNSCKLYFHRQQSDNLVIERR